VPPFIKMGTLTPPLCYPLFFPLVSSAPPPPARTPQPLFPVKYLLLLTPPSGYFSLHSLRYFSPFQQLFRQTFLFSSRPPTPLLGCLLRFQSYKVTAGDTQFIHLNYPSSSLLFRSFLPPQLDSFCQEKIPKLISQVDCSFNFLVAPLTPFPIS